MVIKIEDITIIEKIFGSLTLKFIFIVYLINESNDIDELQSSLLIHEQKSNRQKMKEQALRVSFNNYYFFTLQRGGQGRGRRTGNNNYRFTH
jgi:hypothetical protein